MTISVSNYLAEEMRFAHTVLSKRGIPFASNQIQYSFLHRKPELDGALDACRELRINLIAYSPLTMSALTGKYLAKKRAGGFRRFLPNSRRKAIDAVRRVVGLLCEIGTRYDKSCSQVALCWSIANGNVLPIPGAGDSR